jgi:hypothetical protein
MAEQEFNFALTQADIDGLAAKLDKFSESLNEKEQAALVGVFAAASTSIEAEAQEGDVQGFAFLPVSQGIHVTEIGLGNTFRGALSKFTPGAISHLGGNPLAGDSVGVTGTIMF